MTNAFFSILFAMLISSAEAQVADTIRTFYPDGILKSEYFLIDGKMDGAMRSWYESGALASIYYYENGQTNGTAKGWYENGELSFRRVYTKGSIVTSESWYENGNRTCLMKYKNGECYFSKCWYEDGIPQSFSKDNARKMNSTSKHWYPNGNIMDKHILRAGVPMFSVGSEDDLPDESTIYYVNGVAYTNATMKEGKLYDSTGVEVKLTFRGSGLHYYENGHRKSAARFRHGVKDGRQKYYNEQGKLLKVEIYDRGKLIKTVDHS